MLHVKVELDGCYVSYWDVGQGVGCMVHGKEYGRVLFCENALSSDIEIRKQSG